MDNEIKTWLFEINLEYRNQPSTKVKRTNNQTVG
jgi:hypothetical protein